jgi:hypothetical protein
MFQLIKKDSGEGVVCAVNKNQILIAPLSNNVDVTQTQKSCPPRRCGSCGGCSFVSDGYAATFHIPVNNPNDFHLGDHIRFNRFIPEPNITSILSFGIPVIFTVIAIICCQPSFYIALAGLFCGFIVLGIIDNIFKKRYPPSVITKEGRQQ